MNPLRVILVDDHNLVRAGFRSLLENIPDVEIVAEADNGYRALELIRTHKPDMVLMDIALPDINGLDVTAQVTQEYPSIKVVLLSMYDNEEYVLRALEIGAAGYLLKDADANEFELAIHAIANGKAYLSPAISSRVIESYQARVSAPKQPITPLKDASHQDALYRDALYRDASHQDASHQDAPHPDDCHLTARQREVLRLIAEGFTTKEIAQQLNLSAKTVDAHRTQLMRELNIHEIAGLVRYAIRIGLISAES
jgi:DNA-binding NarL/FixJ family response regulator